MEGVMHGRTPVAVMVLLVAAVALPSAPASAQVADGTADQAQAASDFPVYEITRRLGLPPYYTAEFLEDHPGCSRDVQAVHVELRRGSQLTNGRRWIAMRQADARCAVGAVGQRVRTVRIFGRRVTVRRYCAGYMVDSCKGQPASRRVHTMLFSLRAGSERTFIALSASRLSIRAMLRAVRSLRHVDLSRPVVHLTGFRSPDGNVWCTILMQDGGNAFCGTRAADRYGRVRSDGRVVLCDQGTGGCVQNWDFEAPLLAEGQASALHGFSCLARGGAVTCTLTEGEHAGKGFRIDASGVVEVSP
jgi:hypothetical protein